MAGPIVVSIVGDNRKLSSAVDSSQSKLGRLGSVAGKVGKIAALGLAAGAAGAVVLGKKLIDAGEAMGTSNARIGQVAKSMGLFGKESDAVTGRLIKLAESQARATGIDQNSIKMTQAKLLTFKELGKSADKVGGNFDRATTAALDLASAGFGSAETNAAQLGKALNDPIKGLTSLTKSGVTFTETEKARIQTLVESNRMGEAQNTVLKAIEKQVGGTAVATANGTDKIKVGFSQLAEQGGAKLTPFVDKLANLFLTKGVPAIKAMIPPIMEFIRAAGDRLGPIISKVAGIIRDSIIPALQKAAGRFSDMKPTIDRIVTAAGQLAPIVAKVAGFIGGVLVNAISIAIPIAAKIAATILETGVAAVKAVAGFASFVGGVREKVGAAMDFVRGIPGKITAVFSGAKTYLSQAGRDIIAGLVAGLDAAKQWVIDKIQQIADVIPQWVKKRLGIASPSRVMAAIGVDTVRGIVVGLAQGAPGVVAGVDKLTERIESAWKKLDVSGKMKKKLPAALKAVSSEVDQLKAYARQYEAVAATIDQARQLAAGTADTARSFASVAGLGSREVTTQDAAGNDVTNILGPTAATITEDLNGKLQALQNFTNHVDALRQAGLNQQSVDQIIQEGVEKGSLTAGALVAGGPQAVAAVNGLQAQIDAAAGQLGAVAAVNMYGTGQQAAAGFVSGLEADLEKLDQAATKLAKRLVRAIRRELKIKSPSRVAAGLARNFTDGIVIQTTRDAGRVAIAGKATARAMIDGFGEPRAQLSADALQLAATRGQQTIQLELSAEQLDSLQRGARLAGDLSTYTQAGGRVNL